MRGDDKRIGWTGALMALLVLAAVSLGGYLPGAAEPRQPPKAGPGTVIPVLVMLAISIVIVVIGLVAAMRRPKTRTGLPDVPAWEVHDSGRSRRFYVFVGVAVVVFGVLIVLLELVSIRGRDDAPLPSSEQPAPEHVDRSPGANPPDQTPIDNGPNMFPALAGTVAVLAVLLAGGAILVLRRNRFPAEAAVCDDDDAGPGASVSDSLARAAELGLAEMSDPARDPRAAIIACYAAMERALSSAPDAAPQLSDTPTEVLARAVDHDVLHSGAAAELVGLFTEARFSPHRMTETHRNSAVRLLQLVSADLRSSA